MDATAVSTDALNAFKEDAEGAINDVVATVATMTPKTEFNQKIVDIKTELTAGLGSVSDLQDDVAALTAGLLGVNVGFPADNCAKILATRSNSVHGCSLSLVS